MGNGEDGGNPRGCASPAGGGGRLNDWLEVAELHHQLAAWGAVASGPGVIRSTSRGVSAVIDASGRVIARASTFDGPVVLVADVPVAPAALPPLGRINWPLYLSVVILSIGWSSTRTSRS